MQPRGDVRIDLSILQRNPPKRIVGLFAVLLIANFCLSIPRTGPIGRVRCDTPERQGALHRSWGLPFTYRIHHPARDGADRLGINEWATLPFFGDIAIAAAICAVLMMVAEKRAPGPPRSTAESSGPGS